MKQKAEHPACHASPYSSSAYICACIRSAGIGVCASFHCASTECLSHGVHSYWHDGNS
jgi:hypothetical protein